MSRNDTAGSIFAKIAFTPRWNLFDLLVIACCIQLARDGHFWIACATIVFCGLLSAKVERMFPAAPVQP